MRAPLLAAMAALGAITAVALLAAAATVQPSSSAIGETDAHARANRELVFAFYDAVNLAVRTGDTGQLFALLDPAFVDEGAPPTAGQDRDGLIRRVLAIRAAAPATLIEPVDVAANGDRVVARVEVTGAVTTSFAGLPLDDGWTVWGPVDVFRIAGDVIVARVAPALSVYPLALIDAPIDVHLPRNRSLSAVHVTLPVGDHGRYAAPGRAGPRVVAVESGAVEIQLESGPGNAPPPPEMVTAGGWLAVPASTGFTATQRGSDEAVLLDVSLEIPPYQSPDGPPPDPDGTPQPGIWAMADELWVTLPLDNDAVRIGRAVVSPGARLSWSPAGGPVLLLVDQGTLTLTATGAVPWVAATDSEHGGGRLVADLTGGDGALLEAGTSAEFRAGSEPATVLIVGFGPDTDAPTLR